MYSSYFPLLFFFTSGLQLLMLMIKQFSGFCIIMKIKRMKATFNFSFSRSTRKTGQNVELFKLTSYFNPSPNRSGFNDLGKMPFENMGGDGQKFVFSQCFLLFPQSFMTYQRRIIRATFYFLSTNTLSCHFQQFCHLVERV